MSWAIRVRSNNSPARAKLDWTNRGDFWQTIGQGFPKHRNVIFRPPKEVVMPIVKMNLSSSEHLKPQVDYLIERRRVRITEAGHMAVRVFSTILSRRRKKKPV
jgi:hypothetical protein